MQLLLRLQRFSSNTVSMSCKSVAETYHERIWNDKDLGAIDDCLDENIVIHSALGDYRGKDGMRTIVQAWLRAFPDLYVHNQSVFCESNLVVIHWQANGTHLEEFNGKKTTRRKVAYSGVTSYRMKHNKICEYQASLDMQDLLSQIN